MSAYGIASFIDGVFRGREIRHGWEDRKDAKERQKRLDALTEAREARVAEEHSWRRGDHQSAIDDRDYYRTAAADAMTATNGPLGAPQADLGVSTKAADPVAGVAAHLGIPMGALPDPASEVMQRTMPAESLQPREEAAASGPTRANAESLGRAPIREVVPDFERQGQAPVREVETKAPQSYTYAQWQGMSRSQRKKANLPTSEIGAQLYFDRFSEGMGAAPASKMGAADAAAREAADAEAFRRRGIDTAREAVVAAEQMPRAMRAQAVERLGAPMGVAPGPSRRYGLQGTDLINPEPGRPGTGPRIASASAATAAPIQPQVPASAPPATKEMATTAVQALASTATPAMQATAAVPPKPGELGAAGKAPVTEGQRDRAAASFMDRYREHGAPIVIEAMLKRGDFAKAEAFQEFLDRGETKAGMENWSRAAFAATVGDFDAFADNIVEAYNRLDYFGDDTTILRDKSGFTTGPDGSISGAVLTFKDEKTGDTFEKTFDDANDLVEMGITLLAPENAFEYYNQRAEAARQSALGAREAQAKTDEAFAKRVDAAAKVIYEGSADLSTGKPTMTYGEARQQAISELRGDNSLGAAPSAPPVLYRGN